jgi:hypothetical protein
MPTEPKDTFALYFIHGCIGDAALGKRGCGSRDTYQNGPEGSRKGDIRLESPSCVSENVSALRGHGSRYRPTITTVLLNHPHREPGAVGKHPNPQRWLLCLLLPKQFDAGAICASSANQGPLSFSFSDNQASCQSMRSISCKPHAA